MSLKVWLPLNGNLENQGASAMTATNSGATVNTAGKIGSCYSFDGADDFLTLNNFNPNGWPEISISAWVYPTADFAALFLIRGGSQHRIRISTNGFMFRDTNNSSTQREIAFSPTISVNVWTHITCVYKRGEIWIYQNGIQTAHSTAYYNATSTLLSDMGEFRIGRQQSTSGNIYYTGKVNDFRIYDHALSAAEVHEISQGLVLHYKLDDNVQTITNAFNMGSWNTNAVAGGFSTWGSSGHKGSRGANTDRNYIYNADRTYSYWIANGADSTPLTYLFYQSPAFEGGYRSLSAILKEENGNLITEDIIRPAWNANVVGEGHAPAAKWTRVASLGNGFYLCQVDGLYQDGSNDLAGLNVTRGHKVYISEIWLENNRQVASNPLFPASQIQDSSGYGHNGTIVGNLNLIKDTSRYSVSTNFNGSSAIKYTDFNLGNIWSAGAWVYSSSAVTTTWGALFTVNTSGGDTDLKMNLYLQQSSGQIQYSANGQYDTSQTFTKNVWHHLMETFNGTTLSCYLDGVLIKTKAITNAEFIRSNLYVGARSNAADGSSAANYINAYISDFRIYCTALSAEDVKSLYEMGGKIDNKQNLHIYEAVEMQPAIKLTKQGQMKAGEFQEDTATKLYKTNQIVETNNLIEF